MRDQKKRKSKVYQLLSTKLTCRDKHKKAYGYSSSCPNSPSTFDRWYEEEEVASNQALEEEDEENEEEIVTSN